MLRFENNIRGLHRDFGKKQSPCSGPQHPLHSMRCNKARHNFPPKSEYPGIGLLSTKGKKGRSIAISHSTFGPIKAIEKNATLTFISLTMLRVLIL